MKVRIIGNAPSVPSYVGDDLDCIHIALNMAPLVISGVPFDDRYVCWVQDPRFMIAKGERIFGSPEFSDLRLVALDTVAPPKSIKHFESVPLLGRFGFSLDPSVGVYEGYTAAYGAIQLALRYRPEVIEFYGVDLTYGLRPTRFYQTSVSWDLDLHVHARQLENLHSARVALEKIGVECRFMTASLLDRFVPIKGRGAT